MNSTNKQNENVEKEKKDENEFTGNIKEGKNIDSVEDSKDEKISSENTDYSSKNSCSCSLPSRFMSESSSLSTNQTTVQVASQPRCFITQKHILSSFTDQRNTKILQNLLMKEASKENIESIVNELRGTYRKIMKDKNGNYFCSDLFEVCDQSQRIKILKEITKYISEDCVDHIATHPIQTLIKFSSSEEEYNLILDSFDYNSLFFACLDGSGSYVIKKIIEHIPERYRTKFNSTFIQLICFISGKKYGVTNAKIFCSCIKNEETIEQIVNLIKNDFLNIATNQYGCYLIEHILQLWHNSNKGGKIKEDIISNFKVLYASQKPIARICNLFLSVATIEEKNRCINKLKLDPNYTKENTKLINIILQSMGCRYPIANNNFFTQNQLSPQMINYGNNNNQNNYINPNNPNNPNNPINPNIFPITLNNYNNNFMNQNQIRMPFQNNYQ